MGFGHLYLGVCVFVCASLSRITKGVCKYVWSFYWAWIRRFLFFIRRDIVNKNT